MKRKIQNTTLIDNVMQLFVHKVHQRDANGVKSRFGSRMADM